MLQVFEHQRLLLNADFQPQHLAALLRFNDAHSNKYFTAIHRGVKFSHYVGVLQVGDLTIEILPKADKQSSDTPQQWRSVLLEMLAYCQLLRLESLTNAALALRHQSLLDIYIHVFLTAVEDLLRQGLVKQYEPTAQQNKSLKGQLQFQKHLTLNLIHKEKFFTKTAAYTLDYPLHQVLAKALRLVQRTTRQQAIKQKCRQLLFQFPSVSDFRGGDEALERMTLHRKTAHYQTALDIARLLLRSYCPDLQSGNFDVLAILFDMNLLFEQYVFQSLQKCSRALGFVVQAQPRQQFWQHKTIRPDLVLQTNNQQFVLDTKWKILDRPHPSDADLKQMFVYGHYFEAARGVLIYPKTAGLAVSFLKGIFNKKMYHEKTDKLTEQYCDLCFVAVVKNGRLNRELGQEILAFLKV